MEQEIQKTIHKLNEKFNKEIEIIKKELRRYHRTEEFFQTLPKN